MSNELQPVRTFRHGFAAALDELAANTEKRFGIPCQLQADEVADFADTAVATHLYRITQEALSNAVKHSQASQIAIQLSVREDRITLSVSDNGTGLPPVAERGQGMGSPACGIAAISSAPTSKSSLFPGAALSSPVHVQSPRGGVNTMLPEVMSSGGDSHSR
jgi:signal transduction histidine kinase